MPKLSVRRAATSKILRVFIQKISDGRPLTGLTSASGSLTAYYILEGASAPVAISLVTATVGTWTSGGFIQIDVTNLPGWYELHLPNAALATGASVGGMLKGAADMLECPFEIALDAIDVQDAVRMGLTALPNAVAGANGGLPLGNASGQTTMGATATGAITAASFAAGAIDAAAIATDAIGSAELAATAGAEIATAVRTELAVELARIDAAITTRLATAGYSAAPSAATNAAAVWDELIATHLGTGKTGAALNAAGSAGDPWTTSLPGSYGAGTAGKIIGDNINGTISSRASQASIDTIDDFVDTEVAAVLAAVDTEVAAIKTKTDALPASPAATSDIPSAAVLADAVWDEALSGHAGSGSTGAALSGAGASGDPWTTALPGSYGAGTAGKIIGDNINATMLSRASQTSVDTVDDLLDTELPALTVSAAAIKAKTDTIPVSPAAVGSAMTLSMAQVVPTTNTAQTVGDALNAARAQGFGKWEIVGDNWILYAADGTTIVRTFVLDDSSAPTSRV